MASKSEQPTVYVGDRRAAGGFNMQIVLTIVGLVGAGLSAYFGAQIADAKERGADRILIGELQSVNKFQQVQIDELKEGYKSIDAKLTMLHEILIKQNTGRVVVPTK